MAEHFDLVIKGGTIVNHDGIAEGDIGIVGGRMRVSAAFRGRRAPRFSKPPACISFPA